MKITALDISTIVGGIIVGDPKVEISGPAKIEEGKPGTITFLANRKYEQYLYSSESSAILVDKNFIPSEPLSNTLIKVDNVYEAIGKLLAHFDGQKHHFDGISKQAYIENPELIGESVSIGAFAYIDKNVKIGKHVTIYPHAFIGTGSVIGDNTIIYSGVKIYHNCIIGNHCTVHANAVIGSDGFGFSQNEKGEYQKINQIGNVVLEDNVDIGSNTVIDRATMGSTIIRKGTKLDNLIQIAHNVEIGTQTAIAAQAGIAGSAKIGPRARIGGQVGIAGHLKIEEGAAIQAQSGIASSVKKKNAKLFGSPAFEYTRFLRSYAVFRKLPELLSRLSALEKSSKSPSE